MLGSGLDPWRSMFFPFLISLNTLPFSSLQLKHQAISSRISNVLKHVTKPKNKDDLLDYLYAYNKMEMVKIYSKNEL